MWPMEKGVFFRNDAGKGALYDRPSSSIEEKLKRAEAKTIKLLEAENDFLKKHDALERLAKPDER